jgi:hypothetical protein
MGDGGWRSNEEIMDNGGWRMEDEGGRRMENVG